MALVLCNGLVLTAKQTHGNREAMCYRKRRVMGRFPGGLVDITTFTQGWQYISDPIICWWRTTSVSSAYGRWVHMSAAPSARARLIRSSLEFALGKNTCALRKKIDALTPVCLTFRRVALPSNHCLIVFARWSSADITPMYS